MKKISRRSFLAASGLLAASAALTACGGSSASTLAASASSANSASGAHEPITMLYSVGLDDFLEVLHAKYPEVNLEQIPYGGGNNSGYTKNQLKSGILPDIYNTSMSWMDCHAEMEENLVELSGYPFTDNFIPTQIRELEIEGKLYLVPCSYNIYGISYNKTLFEKHGWTFPNSFEELKELVPKIKEAGVEVSATNNIAAAYGFQYVCNLADTLGLSNIDGVKWQKDFLSGNATAEEGFGAALDYMQEWVDLGMIEGPETTKAKGKSVEFATPFDSFADGNTAFFIGILKRQTQNADGTGDQYTTMPYLSRDGSNNMVITMVNRYYGINKALNEPGNEQKLEDALHVLEVIASEEGQTSLNRKNTMMYTVKNAAVDESNPFYEAVKTINDGYSAPFLYDGWVDVMVPFGNSVNNFMDGLETREKALSTLDNALQESLTKSVPVYAHADEEIGQDALVQLVGQAYCEEVGADCALVSQDAYRERGYIQNRQGVCGSILPLDIDDESIAVFTPGGRKYDIMTVTLSGKRIKEVQEAGFDFHGIDSLIDENLMANFPYTLVTKEGFTLDDATEYQVVVCGATDALKEEGNIVDTGILGSTAVIDYFNKLGNPMHFTEKDIQWN